MRLTSGGYECHHMVDEILMQPGDSQLIYKPHNDVGKSPEIDRCDKSDTFLPA